VALIVIATVYAEDVSMRWLLGAIVLFAGVPVSRTLRSRNALLCGAFAIASWVCMLESGVEPVVVGLAFGLITYAYPAGRSELERASERFREFREQPTPELARSVGAGLRAAISPNERLQVRLHPWTSYAIVPVFALANAGIDLGGGVFRDALTSPITLGVFFGYLLGKPIGIVGGSWLLMRASRLRRRSAGRPSPE
jgi:Na+/H+ antiporter NhaA